MSDDQELKQTSIRMKQKHFDIVEENGLNLSKWVRKQLEKQFG
jgi:hypothetical protein